MKYGGFLAAAVNSVLGTELPLPHFLLPLGISFYIFQTSAYLIDISRGKHRAERSFLRYALFVCYFPQLVQGPINRFADLQPQLTEGNDFSWDNIQHGFLRMLYGVLKKAMIADTLAPIVAKIYGSSLHLFRSGNDYFARSCAMRSFMASTPTRTAALVSSLMFWSRPAASRS